MSTIFVTGPVGVGKSTLLKRVIDFCAHESKIYGFCTEKVSDSGRTGSLGKVFIYPALGPPCQDDEHCVADILSLNSFNIHTAVFETRGIALLSDIPQGSVVMMDELGFLESTAPEFCKKVFEIISGNYIVLGAIKPVARPFLDAVRTNPSVSLFEITEQNRDSAAKELISAFRTVLESKENNSGEFPYV